MVVLLFGSKRLPDAARSLGKSMRIFKSEVKELQADSKAETPVTPAQPGFAAPAQPVPSERVPSERLDVSAPPPAPNPTDIRPA